MFGNPWVQASTCKLVLSSSMFITPSGHQNFGPRLPTRLPRELVRIRVSSANAGQSPPPSAERKNPLAVVLDIPSSIWRQTLRPLSDFGFGKKSVWEGGIGLFVVSGAVLLALSLVWLRGFQLRSKFRKYQAVLEFEQACGICMGTPVRIRGVTVGSVVRIVPSLRSIEAVVEVEDDKIIIPQNSSIEVNQSGLLMETLIDITPQDPMPTPSVGPLDPECVKEGLIVCDRQKIAGRQGISLDELVGIFTRLGREMEEIGVSKSYALAEKVASILQESKPLLAKIEAMTEDIQPLLSEVRGSGLLREVENLTKSLKEATEDLRRVNSSILTPENTNLLQQSISTLIFTLKNIESITSDISGFTGDEATRQNLKLLIKSLSRLL
ncbi:protein TRIGALACTOSYLDIACYLGLYCEROL 2, chloroplastic [Magnolia sinica]|uniref:protein TRIGALACTOSYLDIACYLGLYCEROL 2, chloroplastic n=1 Tax=Magnolia sinica TaxID=86752 RepID=UPI00265807DF|nr:protein TRIGALACTOSYLDIACYLGLYCEROL 2, chloroplastic [Magnolia sinica]XP_058109675.1 protein TRIGALACTOSYLDIACYLGLYCEROL 2, chloroplastic [Magnolia sinica]XP_058109676.1 protein TRIGALACTOSYLDIACYLGLYCEROL 2, chloroplastic [Magnolia sinica]XP_058109677.1 protein TRIGALACTOSYLDIACYLGLYCEROL 2, chloroplastic [Magnolia sinica]XP_058109678.1 protein TRIGALACTOSYLDIACYLGLYCEROL 2, chloroplastic [Magnolia sinica]